MKNSSSNKKTNKTIFLITALLVIIISLEYNPQVNLKPESAISGEIVVGECLKFHNNLSIDRSKAKLTLLDYIFKIKEVDVYVLLDKARIESFTRHNYYLLVQDPYLSSHHRLNEGMERLVYGDVLIGSNITLNFQLCGEFYDKGELDLPYYIFIKKPKYPFFISLIVIYFTVISIVFLVYDKFIKTKK